MPKIENFPAPKNKKEVQKFIGVVNYYRLHLPNLAQIATPLYELIGQSKRFEWLEQHEAAFEKVRHMLLERLALCSIQTDEPLQLYTDASLMAVGAVLKQGNKTISYFSHRFTPTEQRYSTFDREALAMVLALKNFRHRLIGRQFTVYTDHRPLTYWLVRPPPSERHARWIIAVQDLNFAITYLPGEDNMEADF